MEKIGRFLLYKKIYQNIMILQKRKLKKKSWNIFNKNYKKGAFYYEAILQIDEKK